MKFSKSNKSIWSENNWYRNHQRKDIKKAAKILKQWLDNNGDDKPDNSLVVDELIKNNAILAMGKTENDLDNSFDKLIDILEESDLDVDNFERSLIGLISDEPNIAYLEEILHLVTQVGYANAYPEVFGEFKGSRISEAMDIARGGFFKKPPKFIQKILGIITMTKAVIIPVW